MCGICGFVGSGSVDDLNRMATAVKHRGPDDFGIASIEKFNFYLAHTRLSIIDIENGKQPMADINREFIVSFNGEIYNHIELRSKLIKLGHKFTTLNSDTEVLLLGWKQWGKSLLNYLDGMFAFAILDINKQKLILARDRFGEKPLFWSAQNNNFYFGSELTTITKHSHFQSSINETALKKYFGYGFVPAPMSLIKNVNKLKGGTFLEYDIADRKIVLQSYFEYQIEPDESLVNSANLSEELFDLLCNSTRNKLNADVPIGLFLSGGLDSSSILAAAKKVRPDSTFETFTIGFQNKSFDETHFAELVANSFQTNHHTKVIDLADVNSLMDKIFYSLDEPISDPSIIPTFLLSEFASTKVKVALSGDGGDEFFAGYDPFKALIPGRVYQTFISKNFNRKITSLIDLLPISNKNMSLDFKIKRFLLGMNSKVSTWNPVWMAPFDRADIEDLLNEPIKLEDLYSEAISLWDRTTKLDNLDKSLEYFVHFYLQDNILVKADRSSMLNGLETRAVFLDPQIAKFSMKLPNKFKLKANQQKLILKNASSKHLPKSIIKRPKKGFGVPLIDWLEKINFEIEMQENNHFDSSKLIKLQDEHLRAKRDHRMGLWSALPLQKFIEKYQA